jgi:photosynthetic reaction center cytochrome c subunit
MSRASKLEGIMGRGSIGTALVALALLLAGCERPPVATVQGGYRGTGMEQVYNPRTLAKQAAANELPTALPPVPSEGPKAGQTYQNVKVLGDLSVGEFTRTMVAITNWVAPEQGCNYCHNPQNLADDSLYTKVVARRMIQMTQHINADWKAHVANTGVTCYTCHRGSPVPNEVWFAMPAQKQMLRLIGDNAQQNMPAPQVGLSSLPADPFSAYFAKDALPIRVGGDTALPSGNRKSIKQAEWTYSLMMHMSQSLGVNCTFCHNTQNFGSWAGSTPQRVTAYHGIRMVRDLNVDYLEGLTKSFPKERLGPTGDVAKVNCATCHQGAYKPLYGKSMLKDHPELASLAVKTVGAATPPTASSAEGAIFYFAVGSAALAGDAQAAIAQLATVLKAKPELSLVISGYHSAAGTLEQNQELAKQRAFALRDALKAAGVPDKQIKLEKPQQTEANLAGEDPKARRVEAMLKANA